MLQFGIAAKLYTNERGLYFFFLIEDNPAKTNFSTFPLRSFFNSILSPSFFFYSVHEHTEELYVGK